MANEAAGRHQCKGSEENRSHASFRVGNTNLTSALACRADLILTNVSSSRKVSGARDCPKGGKSLVSVAKWVNLEVNMLHHSLVGVGRRPRLHNLCHMFAVSARRITA